MSNIIRYEWPKDVPVPRAEKDDRGVHAERADAVQSRIRAQYQKDRRPLADFLQEHFPDKELLERF